MLWNDLNFSLNKGADGDLAHTEDFYTFTQALYTMIMMPLGQDLEDEFFGTTIREELFETITDEVANRIRTKINDVIVKYDDRITINDIIVEADEVNRQYNVEILFSTRGIKEEQQAKLELKKL